LRTLKRYIGWELLRAFALSLGVFSLAIYFANSVQFIQRGLDLAHLVKLTPVVLGTILSYSLPVSVLTACIICYGRLAADNEFLGATASGIHPFSLLGPSIWLGVGAAVLALALHMEVVPEGRYRISVGLKEVLSKVSYRLLNVGQNVFHVPGGAIYCEGHSSGKLLNVVVIQNDGPQISSIYHAREGVTRFDEGEGAIVYELRDGVYSMFRERGEEENAVEGSQRGVITSTFEMFDRRLEFGQAGRGRRIKELGLGGLTDKVDKGGEYGREAWVELHSRLALGFAPLAFMLVGGPLGLLTKRGDRLSGFFVALALAVVIYYPLYQGGKTLAEASALAAAPALWLGNMVIAVVGVVLYRRVVRG